jgi:iron complex outermembrane receptor protein
MAVRSAVFAQSTSGGEAVRLSIGGSGIQRSPLNYLAGVSVLLDGIPITTSTGAPWELVEPLAANHVEILRGGNAFEYGAKTLGGAIDYISHTGFDSKPFQGRVEAGSIGYWRGQLSTGGFKQDGYRENSGASSIRFVGNVGYKITPELETRFYFRFAHEHFQVPNTLTYAQLQSDPRQAASGKRQAAPLARASGASTRTSRPRSSSATRPSCVSTRNPMWSSISPISDSRRAAPAAPSCDGMRAISAPRSNMRARMI